jgi:WD40 repeat protein
MKKFPLFTALLLTIAPLFLALLFSACDAGPRHGSGTEKAPDVRVFPQVSGSVHAVVFSPDDRYVLPSDSDGDVRVFPQVMGNVYSAVWSPDNRYVLTGDSDGAVKVWDVETGTLTASYYGHGDLVMSVAWSPDGTLIASGSWDNTIKIWSADFSSETREPITLSYEDRVYSVAFSPDSRFVVSGSRDKTVSIWDATSGRELHVLSVHTETVASVAFSPDGKRIVSASGDGTVMTWDAETGGLLHTLRKHTDVVHSAAWSPDGRRIVSASWDRTVRIWDAETGNLIQTIGNGTYDNQVLDAKFSPDGKQIAVAYGYLNQSERGITIWDAETGAMLRQFSEHASTVASIEWDSLGRRVLTASYDSTARIHDAETGDCLMTFAGKTKILRHAALSPDGKRLVTGDYGNKVNVWNAETGVLEQSLKHTGYVYTVAISPDSRTIAAGARSDQIKLWDAKTGNELRTFRGHSSTVFALAFNPNGLLASASADRTIRIWNPKTGAQLQALSGHENYVVSLAFSADGKRLVSGSYDNTVRVWELYGYGQYRLRRKLTGHYDSVYSVAISPDGSKAASASRDGTVRVWDIETGRAQTLTADIFMNGMWSVAFSPDDRFIIAGSTNGQILRYEIDDEGTYRYKDVKDKLLGSPFSLSYVSKGTRILAGISDGTARIYNVEDLSEIACFVAFSGEDRRGVAARMTEETSRGLSRIDGEWLTITHDGYYRSSPKGARFINVLIDGRRLSTIDAYSGIFYRPDVVEARLQGKLDLENTGFSIQQVGSFERPSVVIQTPQPGTTVTGNGSVTLKVEIKDRNQPIKDIRVLINGVRLGGEELGNVTGTSGIAAVTGGLSLRLNTKTVEFSVPVTLVERGANRIEVMAFNGYSWGYSGEYSNVDVFWEPPTGTEVPLPDLWILAVGVNTYDNARTGKLPNLGNLNFCVDDAKGLVESFEAQQDKRYKTIHSRLLIDGEIEPTAENIRRHLSFLEGAGQRDVVLLFLGGHGISEGNKFYFLTKDAVMRNGKVNPAYAISDELLKDALNKPGRRLIFIDACQSGGMDINNFMHSLQRTNAYILSSSEGNSPSYEDPPDRKLWSWNGHGVFSYSIIRSLSGEAEVPRGNWDGISVLGLSLYVREDVKKLTEGFRYQQRPVQYTWGFSDFDIAR